MTQATQTQSAHYTTSFTVDRSPREAYAAVIDPRAWWSEEIKGLTDQVGAEFLHRFVDDVPWAHLDIAGVGWDLGKPWAAKGGSGFGVRLLVALAQAQAGGA